jgi:hypothetical protein
MADSRRSESGSDLTLSPRSPSSLLYEDIRTLAEQLYDAWSSNAPVSTLADIRDEVLASRNRVDVQILTLSSVAKIACPQQILEDDTRWTAFFTLASACAADSDTGDEADRTVGSRRKRKRTDNAAARVRNLALLAALWSPGVIEHYGWSSAGNAQINVMRACALRWPRFVDDFCPRLNSILLQRHCEALRDSRVRGLNEASVQPLRDFNITSLETAVVDLAQIEQWTHSKDGDIPVDNHGSLLNQLRPNHFHMYLLQQDRYGMLVSRNALSAPRSSHVEASVLPFPLSPFADREASLSPFSLSPFATDLTGSMVPDGDDASNFNSENLSLDPPLPDTTFASTESTSTASSSSAHASTSEGDRWTTPLTCTIVSNQGEELRASQESCMRQAYNRSPPQLTLDPAVLSLSHNELFWEHVHDPSPFEQSLISEHFLSEGSSLSAIDSTSRSGQGSLRPRQQVAELRPALPPLSTVVSNETTELTVCSTWVDHRGLLTVEEALHNKYRSKIMAYVEKIFKEAESADASVQRKLRAKWLTDRTAWASFLARDEPRHSSGGQLHEEFDVLFLTSDEFVAAASRDEIFDKPILIKESFSDSGMHTVKGLASQLIDTSPNATIDVISLDREQPDEMSIQDFINCTRTDQSRKGCGVKALNLRNVTKAHRPLFTMLSRFRLLESLADRAQEGNLGKRTRPFLTDVSGSINFNVLGTAGAFLGPQLNALSGTWVRNLAGVKLWMIVPESAMDAAEWEAFGKLGSSWIPHSGSKLLVLEQDDVLLMPPGSKVVHAVHSLTDDVMEGGMFWDDLNVIATLQAILWIGKHQMATNEGLTHQLPRIVDELGLLVRSQVDRFRGTLSTAEFLHVFDGIVSELKDLGCQCGSRGCVDECSCRELGRRCSSWCLAHEEIRVLNCLGEVWENGNNRESNESDEENATRSAEEQFSGYEQESDDWDEDEDEYMH